MSYVIKKVYSIHNHTVAPCDGWSLAVRSQVDRGYKRQVIKSVSRNAPRVEKLPSSDLQNIRNMMS